ncbi:hypothetical protein N656DRAFT_558489 [Canariomyces notabilis]|uniref:Uncharacterized protein n=1 Tax=Canariomyces notabilis TaxID=2074819 RepID=A0AAN6QE69_9PEZI|nr:hypothetical protein N656DRAFT_558489 [Canariomyces arenarius]
MPNPNHQLTPFVPVPAALRGFQIWKQILWGSKVWGAEMENHSDIRWGKSVPGRPAVPADREKQHPEKKSMQFVHIPAPVTRATFPSSDADARPRGPGIASYLLVPDAVRPGILVVVSVVAVCGRVVPEEGDDSRGFLTSCCCASEFPLEDSKRQTRRRKRSVNLIPGRPAANDERDPVGVCGEQDAGLTWLRRPDKSRVEAYYILAAASRDLWSVCVIRETSSVIGPRWRNAGLRAFPADNYCGCAPSLQYVHTCSAWRIAGMCWLQHQPPAKISGICSCRLLLDLCPAESFPNSRSIGPDEGIN